MKLSDFDLNWYHQWAITHEPLEEWSRPGLTNFLGSVQIPADPTSLRHVMFPPVSGAEESTAYLTINGQLVVASRTPTTVHWTPWSVHRECSIDGWQIRSRTCMASGKPALVQVTTLTNTTGDTRELDLRFRLSGRCVNRGKEPWFWGVPRVGLTVSDIHGHSGLNPFMAPIDTHGLCFRERPVPEAEPGSTLSFAGQAHNAQVLSPAPDQWHNQDAVYSRTLSPGESFSFTFVLAMEPTPSAVPTALKLLENPDTAFAETEAEWRRLWESAFSSGGGLGGQLADLEVPEEIAPVAVSAILCALCSRRTFPDAAASPAYNISFPRRVEACFYPNDWGLAGELMAELDPEVTWTQLSMALAGDIRRNNQVNLLSGNGGDADGTPWPYTIDIYNCFYVGWHLWQQGGARPEELTERIIRLPDRSVPLLEALEDLAFDWRNRKVDAFGLADYGPKEELLECVSTYEHVVAGLNAGAAWMLFRMAEIYQALGRGDDAARVQEEGQSIVDAILRHLYVQGRGYFRSLDPEGNGREVRTCWDFGMVGFCIGDKLPKIVQKEMTAFFQRELQTPGWLRALSPLDADAATSGFRADHQYNGAYGAWPAQCALSLLQFGETDLVKDWLKGIARTARQGPFAQAHYDEGVWPETCEGATKVTDEAPQFTHWCNLSGGLFWAVIKQLYT